MDSVVCWSHKNGGRALPFLGQHGCREGEVTRTSPSPHPYECHVEKTALKRTVIPSNCPPGFPLAEPTEVNLPGQKAVWREGRRVNMEGQREGIWHVSRQKNLETGNSTISCLAVSIHDSSNTFEEGTCYVKILPWAQRRCIDYKIKTSPSRT